jgi:hypothetical protein
MPNSNGSVFLCGLYKNKTKSGDDYLGGKLGYGVWANVYKNKNRRGDRDPEYWLVLRQAEKRSEGSGIDPEPDQEFEQDQVPF